MTSAAERSLSLLNINEFPPLLEWDHEHHMEFGKLMGWWEEYDEVGPIKVYHFPSPNTWEDIAVSMKIFDSKNLAKKNNWVGTATKGDVRFTDKKRTKIIID